MDNAKSLSLGLSSEGRLASVGSFAWSLCSIRLMDISKWLLQRRMRSKIHPISEQGDGDGMAWV